PGPVPARGPARAGGRCERQRGLGAHAAGGSAALPLPPLQPGFRHPGHPPGRPRGPLDRRRHPGDLSARPRRAQLAGPGRDPGLRDFARRRTGPPRAGRGGGRPPPAGGRGGAGNSAAPPPGRRAARAAAPPAAPGGGAGLPRAARGAGPPPPFAPPASRGAPPGGPAIHHRPVPGRRYVHVRPVAGPAGLHPRVRRPRRRVGFALILTGSSPQLRVRLRLSERQGQELAAKLPPVAPGKPDPGGALAMVKEIYAATLPGRIVSRLTQRGLEPDATRGAAFADKVVAGVTSALSTALQERPHLIASAVQDPADGITVTITFRGVTRE